MAMHGFYDPSLPQSPDIAVAFSKHQVQE